MLLERITELLNPATNRLWRLHYPQSECGHRSFIVNSQDATVITRFSESQTSAKHVAAQAKTRVRQMRICQLVITGRSVETDSAPRVESKTSVYVRPS